jgi:alkaline phosphatase D
VGLIRSGRQGAGHAVVPGIAVRRSDAHARRRENCRRRTSSGRAAVGRWPTSGKDAPVQTLLGVEQKAWFLDQLRRSRATWKVWGNSLGTLDSHVDPQNLPTGLSAAWPGQGYACFGGGGDYATAYAERGEIYDVVRVEGITGFATVSGDWHAFWAGLSAKSLPPLPFDPVGVAYITGSVSAPGIVEAYEHRFPKDHPLRALYVADVAGQQTAAVNPLLHHGVRTCLEYQRTGDAAAARRLSSPPSF